VLFSLSGNNKIDIFHSVKKTKTGRNAVKNITWDY